MRERGMARQITEQEEDVEKLAPSVDRVDFSEGRISLFRLILQNLKQSEGAVVTNGTIFGRRDRRMAIQVSQQEGEVKELPPAVAHGRTVLLKLIKSTAVGAAIGSIFGTGAGLVKQKGFKGSLTEGRSAAKTFAILFGLHSHVSQSMIRMRGKDDAFNAGVAGCIAGLAVMGPGSSAVRSCVTFGTFSCIAEGVRKDPDSLQRFLKDPKSFRPQISLPQFTLPSELSRNSGLLKGIELPLFIECLRSPKDLIAYLKYLWNPSKYIGQKSQIIRRRNKQKRGDI